MIPERVPPGNGRVRLRSRFHMESFGRARRVRIYVNEGDRIGHLPAHLAVMQFLRKEGAQGATVVRGIEGFGAAGAVHVSHLVDVVGRLPIVVEWIDQADQVERIMPQLRALVRHGFITADDTEILLWEPHPVRVLAATATAADVMSREVTTVQPETPVRQLVELLSGRSYRGVPVVDRGRVVGIVTSTNLVERGGLQVSPKLLPRLAASERQRQLDELAGTGVTAADVMTPRPTCVAPETPLPDVALIMTRRRLKRLPVVDPGGALLGMVSRYDLLRSTTGGFGAPDTAPRAVGLVADAPLSSVMRRDVPTVHPETPLPETMQAVVSTRLDLAIVVDEERRVVGLVSDTAILERITPALRPGALRSLMLRLPFAHPRTGEAELAAHARAHTAGELMSRDLPTAPEDTVLSDAIALMLGGHHKVLAVTGRDGRLVGVVDRADLLRGLGSGSS
jgi:CBS domain-containing protein